jgi:hypothetical protein
VNTNGLEALINQLHQFDARGDTSVIMRGDAGTNKAAVAPSIDISLSSSHGMSSFLQDFDLNSHPNKQQHQLDMHFNGGHPSLQKLIGLDDDDDVDHLSDPDDDGD